MKNFMFYLVCLGFFFPSISAMHDYAHEEIPTARAIAIPKDHQFYGEAPVEAKAEFSNSHYTQATAEAIPAEAQHRSSINLDAQTEGHINLEHEPPAQNAIAIAENIFEEEFAQPNYTYDAKGNIVSEQLDDGSEHKFTYNADGSTTTTIFDPKKIRQQEIITKPDGSSITKYYDKQGKQTSIIIKNPDGSKVQTINSQEGDILASAITNKANELEAATRLNEYGQRTATTYHADKTATHTLFKPEETVLHDDGTTTTTNTATNGTTTQITKDSNNVITQKVTITPDRNQGEVIVYDPAKPGTIISTTQVTITPEGMRQATVKNAKGDITEEAISDEHGNIIIESKFKDDGTLEIIEYDPTTKTQSFITTMKPDAQGNKIFTKKKQPEGKIVEMTTEKIDGTNEYIDYDEHEKPLSKTTHFPDGRSSVMPL